MILVDTSVWVDHLRRQDAAMARELEAGNVWAHPFVVGEIACGVFPRRAETMALLQTLPVASVASHVEVLGFIERQRLAGRGVGYIDVHLLASTMMTAGTSLWSRDRRLATVAHELRLAYQERGV